MFSKHCVIVKGGGDLATAVAHKLFRAGFPVVITELEKPMMVRRTVSFANCIYEKEWTVEGITSVLANEEGVDQILKDGKIPVVIDPTCTIRHKVKPTIIVDAILAKRNLGTQIQHASIVIGLGPGFTAREDVNVVIETNRGHDLGKLIFEGKAAPNTGVPGDIRGNIKHCNTISDKGRNIAGGVLEASLMLLRSL